MWYVKLTFTFWLYDEGRAQAWSARAGAASRSLPGPPALRSDILQVYISMVMVKVCGVAVNRRARPRMLQNILGQFHLARSAFLARHGKV